MPRFDIQLVIHIHECRHQMGMIREIKSTQRSRILIRKSSNIKTGGSARTYASQSKVEAANGLNLATAPFETQPAKRGMSFFFLLVLFFQPRSYTAFELYINTFPSL